MKDFNEKDELMVLVSVYGIAAVGLNFHHKCWRLHALETSHSRGVRAQTIGRTRRFGNPSQYVWFYEYFVPASFDSKAVARNLEKAIPQAMAELNREIFYGEEPGETTVDVGQWVVEGGTLVPWEESSKTKHILSPHDLVREILSLGQSETIDI